MTRKNLFYSIKAENSTGLDAKLNSFKNKLLSSESYTHDQIEKLKRDFAHFKSDLKNRWTKAHNKEDGISQIQPFLAGRNLCNSRCH